MRCRWRILYRSLQLTLVPEFLHLLLAFFLIGDPVFLGYFLTGFDVECIVACTSARPTKVLSICDLGARVILPCHNAKPL